MEVKPDRGAAGSGPIEVSVVIPSYNSRETIRDCLASVVRQAKANRAEVTVVDSSDDGTPDLIRDEFPQVRLIRREQRTNAGTSRNIGVEHSRGRLLAFLDADCLADPGWLDSVRRVHAEPPGDGEDECAGKPIAGAILNGTPKSLVGTAEWFVEFSEFLPGMPPRPVAFAATANFSIPRSIFLATGGFDDSRTGQDMTFGYTLREAGHPVQFDPSSRVAHRNRTRLGLFLRRQYQLGVGSARVRRRAPLAGHWIVRIPLLIPLLLPYRIARVLRRSFRSGRAYLPALARCSPLIIAGITAWATGFLHESLGRGRSHRHGQAAPAGSHRGRIPSSRASATADK